MKLTVKTLKGSHFEIRVQPGDTIMAVKKNIEDVQGKDNYPCGQQLLIHNGKVLKDESTLDENKVSEDGFLVVMLSKTKTLASGASSAQPTTSAPTPAPISTLTPAPAAPSQAPAPVSAVSASDRAITEVPADAYGQAASNLVAGNTLEQTIQQLMDMGGGSWDKDTVTRALRAAYNNPERAVDYLYSGIPASTEVAVPVEGSGGANPTIETGLAGATPLSGIPNSSPLNMFPQEALNSDAAGGDGSLDFLRNNQQLSFLDAKSTALVGIKGLNILKHFLTHNSTCSYNHMEMIQELSFVDDDPPPRVHLHKFQTLRSMVQANPQILQPMLQELSKQNPQLLRLIQEHHAEFLQLINEPLEGAEGDLFEQPEQDMPHAISVTPAEQEAIERLEAMGFDRALVIEAFLACDRNEELAVNYLLEHAADYDD